MVAGDNETVACGHALNHCPKRIRGELLRSFSTELLETVTRLGKLVDTFIGPMMPKHDGRRGGNPVETVMPRNIHAFSASARKLVGKARAVILD